MAATFKIDDDVKTVLQGATITADRVTLPPQSLDRKLYVKVDKVLKGLGGKWNRSAQAHLFDRDPREALGVTIETGDATNLQQALQAFYTPEALAQRVVELADLADGQTVLEPSCGTGNLISAALIEADGLKILGYDVDEVTIVECAERFAGNPDEVRVSCLDFLTVPSDSLKVDRVIMNPPFTKKQGIAHVTHALEFLAPGGRLVAIVPPNVLSLTDKAHKAFQELYEDHQGEIETVDAGTFKDAGTNIATAIITLIK